MTVNGNIDKEFSLVLINDMIKEKGTFCKLELNGKSSIDAWDGWNGLANIL